ncbi:MAG: hypothetical protein EBS01_00640 [Verrucomicrobia bacterium]|nr:hypothetical protein [Verrucomicrobiota bacterium]
MIAPFLIAGGLCALTPLSPGDMDAVGKRIWQNEADGKVEGLTAWNVGESFASLGIGHFIWYPAGEKGPFEESFPSLLHFLKVEGVRLPEWLVPGMPCPWRTRSEFEADMGSTRMRELRTLLASTISQQSLFLAQRLERALPGMLDALPTERKAVLRERFERLAATSAGRFALIDYVNFKGEGTNPKERYKDCGWGLLQVLEGMSGSGTPADFSQSAAAVLSRRVQNAPPERGEQRWLPGWLNRVKSYAR